MSADIDPLLTFLHGELEQIADTLDFKRRLGVPLVALDDGHSDARSFSWTFRFTWQEVERGRRYVIPLNRERAALAQRAAVDEVVALVADQIIADPRVGPQAIAQLAADAEISRLRLADGREIEFVSDPTVLALPVSEISRLVRFRAGLNAYSVSESVRVGRLRLLRPDLVAVPRTSAE